VCLLSAVDDLLEYKQKFQLRQLGSLNDLISQLHTFLESIGVMEQVAVEVYDSEHSVWKPLTELSACPSKARLRIRRANSSIYTPSQPVARRAVVRQNSIRKKGDTRYISGKMRIWSGTRWNCEHDRRLSECKFCAAKTETLVRQKSDSAIPWTNYQKRQRLDIGSHQDIYAYPYPQASQQLVRQTSLPVHPERMDPRRPLELHQRAMNEMKYEQHTATCTSKLQQAGEGEGEGDESGSLDKLGDDEEWLWDLVDDLERTP